MRDLRDETAEIKLRPESDLRPESEWASDSDSDLRSELGIKLESEIWIRSDGSIPRSSGKISGNSSRDFREFSCKLAKGGKNLVKNWVKFGKNGPRACSVPHFPHHRDA